MSDDDSFVCPNCGAIVPANARACPECGSDDRTGWSDDTLYDGLDLPDPDEFDYDEWLRKETRGPRRPTPVVFATIIAVLILLAWLLLRA